MRVLGFNFSAKPNVNRHVEMLARKMRTRTWSLSRLRWCGFSADELVKFYVGAIRPIAEHASPCYHLMITTHHSQLLERQQNQALKNIFGPEISANKMREKSGISTLSSQREEATFKFAEKNSKNPRFKDWFPLNERQRSTRHGKKFVEKIVRTEMEIRR